MSALNHIYFRGSNLIAYFISGWVFYIPYLSAYLVYDWLNWPVNPVSSERWTLVPCLLHVYWALHVINLILGALALRSWLKRVALEQGEVSTDNERSRDSAAYHRPSPSAHRSPATVLWSLAPWACLALLLGIPGLYLEWPSDPWEHLWRTTEWAIYDTIGHHSAGYKSFYFLTYSVVGWLPAKLMLPCTNLYYAASSLLLAWQYYRLALAVGLGSTWAFLFVTINLLTFGNTCFSFYRYYGLATTVFSQLAAVALTRIVLEACLSSESPRTDRGSGERHAGYSQPGPLRAWTGLALSVLALTALIGFNHVQGFGVAMLGTGAVITWRLLKWKRSAILWFLAGTVALSLVTVLGWPRHPVVESAYRAEGWLSAWYGFNLLDFSAPAAERAQLILGAFGLLNLVAAIGLIRRGHVVGWFTLFPLAALMTPMAALPFANMLAASDASRIVTFHRMLFAVPSGLAVVSWLRLYRVDFPTRNRFRPWGFAGLIGAMVALVATSPAAPTLNRFWNLIAVAPADLQLAGPVSRLSDLAGFPDREIRTTLVTPAILMNLSATINPRAFHFRDRPIWNVPADSLTEAIGMLDVSRYSQDRREEALLAADFGASVASTWETVGGATHASSVIDDNFATSTALQNQRGKPTDVFNVLRIAINSNETYRVEVSLRQSAGPVAECLLAVAWLDNQGRLLESNVLAPAGAANPNGWLNGTYSYFGPIGKPAPRNWTVYRKSFGPGKGAHIPVDAKYVKLGALLNPHAIPDVVIQIANIRMWKALDDAGKDDGAFLLLRDPVVLLPVYQTCWSSASQAAQFSGHWNPQLVAYSLSGGRELEYKAQQLGIPVIPAATAGDR